MCARVHVYLYYQLLTLPFRVSLVYHAFVHVDTTARACPPLCILAQPTKHSNALSHSHTHISRARLD